MPTYSITVFDPRTRTSSQHKKSGQEQMVRASFEKKGFTIVSMQETIGSSSSSKGGDTSRKLKLSELVIFCRSVAIMVKSGNSLSEALEFYSRSSKGAISSRIYNISKRLTGGDNVYLSFQRSGLFDDIFCGVISAGEKGGNMATAFKMLGDRYSTLSFFISKTRRAVSIPIGITVFMGLLFIASQFFVVPMVQKMLKDSHVTPDGFSAAIFRMAEIVRGTWFIWFFGIGGFIGAILFSRTFRVYLMYIAMSQVKQFRATVMGLRQSAFLSTLRVLYGNGVDLLESLNVAATALAKTPMEAELRRAALDYKSGVPLAESLKRNTSCDEKLIHMIRVAEDKDLVAQLENIEEMYTAETVDSMERLSQQVNLTAYAIATVLIGVVFAGSYIPIVLMAARMMTN